jgi:glycosyltransferase involved in cell wall biosynthesis
VEQPARLQSQGLPYMSVVVCVFNGARVISRAIQSLLSQNYPADLYEIVVVDDGSTDSTCDLVSRYPVRLVRHDKNRGLSSARQTGLANIRGDIYVCFDDDCIVDPGWLSQLAIAYKEVKAAGIGSVVEEPVRDRGLANRFFAASNKSNSPSLRLDATRHPLRRYAAYVAEHVRPATEQNGLTPARALNGASGSFPTYILHRVGGWDTSLRAEEDLDLCTRIAKAFPDLSFYTFSAARVTHDPNMTLRQLIRRPYIRGADTLKYYKRSRLVPPIFPYPVAWLFALVAVAVIAGPGFSLVTVILLPQLLYVWWPLRAFRQRSLWPLAFAYIQLAEESAGIIGLIRGWGLLHKDRSD